MRDNPVLKFRGLEITMDNIRMEEQLLPKGFDVSGFDSTRVSYFKKDGFKVSAAFSRTAELISLR